MTRHIPPLRLIAAGSLALAAAGVTAVAASPAAQAVTCGTEAAWSSTSVASSTQMTVPSQSDCQDLNASSARTRDDYVMGWYKSGGTFHQGSKGWVWVPRVENGWKVLLTSVNNGAQVKGTVKTTPQNVQYIY